MLQLYGNIRSRATRCLWMLEEIGAPYRLIEKTTRAEDLQTTDYLRLNPNARIPTLVDGDTVLWESMAINLYLAQKYPGPLPADATTLGTAAQWSFWAMLETEALLLDLLMHRVLLAEHGRDPSLAARDELLLQKPLGILDGALQSRDHLAGDTFSVADLNVASILSWARIARLDLKAHPNVARWLDACLKRPANMRVREMAKQQT
jgi:glutathione S-transferase